MFFLVVLVYYMFRKHYNTIELVEDSMIKQALVASGGNKNKAAKILGLNRTTLVEKLRKKSTNNSNVA